MPIVPTIRRTELGFYQFAPLPDAAELSRHYAEKYYQEAHGSYEVEYDEEERAYLRLKASLIYRQCARLRDMSAVRLLDVGCGEGWVMDVFTDHDAQVHGLDFSEFAIRKFHPRLMPFFTQGDIYQSLDDGMDGARRYEIVVLANVIEHVLQPLDLLNKIKAVMADDALLVVVAPNDFSPLQRYLLEQGIIDEEFWLAYPEHLSYFNKESMLEVLAHCGFDVATVVADNPIDLNLFNERSHYVRDPSLGKSVHRSRIKTDNFLASLGVDKLLDLYTAYGAIGVGRDLNYFCRVRS